MKEMEEFTFVRRWRPSTEYRLAKLVKISDAKRRGYYNQFDYHARLAAIIFIIAAFLMP